MSPNLVEGAPEYSALVAALRKVTIFCDLADSDLSEIAGRCRKRKYAANTQIFNEGDSGLTLYLIVSGRISIQKTIETGVLYIAELGPGNQFGEMALLDEQPRMATAVALTPAEVLTISRTDLLQTIQKSPKIGLRMMSSLAQRLRESADNMASLRDLTVLGRVAKWILEEARHQSPGGLDVDSLTSIRLTQSHEQIGEQIGAARESVSRAFSTLTKSKIIRLSNKIVTILNYPVLRAKAGVSVERY